MDGVAAAPGFVGVGVLAACAVWFAVPAPRTGGRERLKAAVGASRTDRAGTPRPRELRAARVRRGTAAALAGFAAALVIGGLPGVLAAPLVGAAVDRQLGRMAPAADRLRRERMTADLPTAADLLSACLAAGAPPAEAVTAVADAVGGPLGGELRAAAGAVRLGGDPARCWSTLAAHRELAPLARALSRSGEGGAPLAERIAHLADECRDRRRSDLTAAARRTAVRATLPLGVCFLPAFLLIGVLPVVVGLATPLLAAQS
ncbi:type II secretion system F family protein [Yinghuangia sp. YIM S09857]|uniref:type II secretion system F family protein n=1 Tax=Yinghuangia sp. YIM S09857 TaxID=3436929 RepID=UPI003F52A964